MKKIKKILIGTHNAGKFREISYLISKKIKKVSPLKLKINSPKETGKNFVSNSKLKAEYFFKRSNIISISDDSGLCVKCLNGKPGIHSARFAKKYGGFNKAMRHLIELIDKKNKNNKIKNNKAVFVCSLTLKYPGKKSISVEGKIYGHITNKIVGKNGFGYDPIFIPNKKKLTFGQMKKKDKIKIDHRFVAFNKLKKKLKLYKLSL
jgi:XTP/dITP diphosphohydrolase